MSYPTHRCLQSGQLRRSTWSSALWVVAIGLALSPIAAQDIPPAASQPAKGSLGPAYVDGSFGFSVSPPAGCVLYREKQPADADVEIARFVHLPFQWSFTVRLSTTTRALDSKALIDGIAAQLKEKPREFQELKTLRGEQARIASRAGVRYAASFKSNGSEWLRQQAVVPSQQNEYFALVFITPLSDRTVVEPLFDKMIGSFQIVRDERAGERIKAALARGTVLLRQAAESAIDITRKINEDSYLRCIMEGKDIGFVRISERVTELDHRKGVQVREWGWLFNEDGSTSHLQHDMFLSTDLTFERWENRLYVIPAGKVEKPQQILVDVENAMRQNDQLGVAFLPRPNAQEKRDKVISVEKSYSSAAWNALFPRLVDLSKPEVYAFQTYKSERRGMILRTMEVMGPSRVLIEGQQTTAFKIEDSEGLIPPKSEMYVDKSGRLLRLVADRLEMVATTAAFVEQRFGKRVAEAQDLVKKLQPHPPSATPPGRNNRPGPVGPRSATPGAR